jgi:isopenicillin N synthase-like dioxygenase
MPNLSLPAIDISPFLHSTPFNSQAREACARDIFNACMSTGFFYLTNHGIPKSLTEGVLALGRDFFLNSSMEEKNAVARKQLGVGDSDGTRGWQPVRDNVTGGKRDWQEAVDFYREDENAEKGPPYEMLKGKNVWPRKPLELEETYKKYVERMLKLGEIVMIAMGTALGEGNEEVFIRHTWKSFWGMRLIGYAPLPEPGQISKEMNDGGISCGEHTDYGCVTFLLQDSTKGALQIRSSTGEWINADPIPDAFVVNIGDMMEHWTNGLWPSTVHRVIHRGENFRVSIPFFYEPDFNAV